MKLSQNNFAFFELLRAGLWGYGNTEMRIDGTPNWEEVYRLAEEQSVMGLIAAGLDMLPPAERPPQEVLLQFIGSALQIEQQNKDMNMFLARLIEKLRNEGVYTLLVKGQSVAQCYDKPLWRTCGDVDLYLSQSNYEKAKETLIPIASHVDNEDKNKLHIGMTIDSYVVELHGTMHEEISRRMNRGLDEVHKSIFYGGEVRSWNNDGVSIFLPSVDNDVIIVFTHFLQHFFIEGVGLRQICDWCRLLFCYREKLDLRLLESRIKRMRLMTEWKAFYNLASRFLGMLDLGGELMSCDSRFDKRADRIMEHVLESGNFGHNRDVSYRAKNSAAVVNTITLWRRICDFAKFARVFPVDSPRFFGQYLWNRMLYR